MEKRDYLLRQIELMTQAFVSLIRRLLGLKELNEEEVQQTTDEMLKEYLDISVRKIMQMEFHELVELISKKQGIHKSNLDLLAEIIVLNAESRQNTEEKTNLYRKALDLYEWIDKTGDTFSMERFRKMEEIRFLIAEEPED